MRTKKNKKLLYAIGITLVVGLTVTLITGHRWADKHVRYITGGQPSPLNCVPCHAYYKKNGLIKRFTQKNYLSPLDVAISPNGSHLYVTAQDADALLAVSLAKSNTVTKIPVGKRPHSVVISRDGKTAFVSNRWSDNISVIDLSKHRVVQNIEVGNGPTGMALAPEGDFLYVANS
ncbi:MAG: YncE family protein, partial [bacterium]